MKKKSRDRRKANRRKYYSFDAGVDPQKNQCVCIYVGKTSDKLIEWDESELVVTYYGREEK